MRTLILMVASIGLAVAQVRRLEEARALKGHASAAAIAGAYEAALPGMRGAGDRGLLAQAVLEAGQSALAAGEYGRAYDRGREAEALFHDLRDPGNEASAANVVGSADLYRGAYADAIRDFERALRLDRAGHDAKGEINRLSNIGNVYFFQGQYAAALASYEAAMARVNAAAEETWNGSRRQLVLTNLATLYEQLGQYEKARGYYDEALARGASLPASEYGQLLANAGTMYRRLGDPVKALESYEAAQALFAREHLSVAEIHVLQNFGIAQALDFHDLGRAVEAFTRALKLAESPLNKRESVLAHLFRGEAFYRMSRMKEARADFATALAGAREIGAREEQWTALYGLGRIGGSLETFREAIGIIESVRSGLGNSSLKAEFLANKRDVYDAAIALMLESPDRRTETLLPMFEQARSRNLQDALRGAAGPPDLRAIQAELTAGALVIEYWVGADEIAAVWVARDRSGVVNRKLSADEAASVRGFGGMLRDSHDAEWRGAAQHVGELLLGGVPLDGTKHLMIVPDGVLNTIPFEVLGAPLAIERFPVSYLPSAALLLRKTGQGSPAPPWRRELLAFGDPVVDAGEALPGDARWSRLPESGRELREIAGTLRGRATIHAAGDDRKRYLFSGETAGTPLLHFSTHAAVDMTDANRSRILFTPEAGMQGSSYLFRSEVQSIPLRGVDLVTLSACDTESGRLSRGEGIQSFSRAFLAAGARSTVTTLWRVADGPTADFMRGFYEHLARGEAKAEALRAVKLRALRAGGAPGDWAAFVLNGDGRSPIPPVFSWAWVMGPLVVIAGGSVFFRRRYRRLSAAGAPGDRGR